MEAACPQFLACEPRQQISKQQGDRLTNHAGCVREVDASRGRKALGSWIGSHDSMLIGSINRQRRILTTAATQVTQDAEVSPQLLFSEHVTAKPLQRPVRPLRSAGPPAAQLRSAATLCRLQFGAAR